MSDPIVSPEEVKDISAKEKDEKKVKKKKSVKSSDGKSKTTSRKSSSGVPAENGELITVENGVDGGIQAETVADDSPLNPDGISGTEIPESTSNNAKEDPEVDEAEEADKRKVIMLREMDFRKLAELKEAFHLFDINRDGYIDKEDLKFTFTSMGKPDVTDEALDEMLSEMSNDGVDFDAFVKLFGYKAIQLDPEEELLAALAKWDYQGNGMISEEILKRDLQGWGDKFTAKEAERALEEAPLYKKDGTTMIDYVKFCSDICGLRNVEKTRQIEKEANAYEEELRSMNK